MSLIRTPVNRTHRLTEHCSGPHPLMIAISLSPKHVRFTRSCCYNQATLPNIHHVTILNSFRDRVAGSSVVAGSILWTVMAQVHAGNIMKRKRVLTIKDKLKICDSVRKGRSMMCLAGEFNVGTSGHFSYPDISVIRTRSVPTCSDK